MTIEEINEWAEKSEKQMLEDWGDRVHYWHGYYLQYQNFHEKEKFTVSSGKHLNPVVIYVNMFPDDFTCIGYTGGADILNNNIGVFRENNLDIEKVIDHCDKASFFTILDLDGLTYDEV